MNMMSDKTQGDPDASNLLDTPMPSDRAALCNIEPLSNGNDQSGIIVPKKQSGRSSINWHYSVIVTVRGQIGIMMQ